MSPALQRSVAVVCADDERPGNELATRLLDLLEHGWDAHLLYDAGALGLPGAVLRERVHPPPHRQRRIAPRGRLVIGAARTAARRPGAAMRALRTAADPSIRYLQAVLLALDPALVHFLSPPAAARYAGVVPALRGRVLVSAGSADGNTADLEVLRRADAVEVGSEAAAELLRSRGLANDLIAVIPEGVDEALLRIGPRPDRNGKAFRILSVAPLTYPEGYEYALQAVALLAERGISCRYRIIGSGDFADAVAFARHQLGLERVVEIFDDPGDRDALVAHFTWADAFLSAAVASRGPAASLDVQAAGLPMVSTGAVGSDQALVVPSRNPEALAEQLALLAADPALRQELADRGRREARSTIGKRERLELTRAFYARVLG